MPKGTLLVVPSSRLWSCLKRNGVRLKRAEGEGGISELVGRDGRVRVFGKGDQRRPRVRQRTFGSTGGTHRVFPSPFSVH